VEDIQAARQKHREEVQKANLKLRQDVLSCMQFIDAQDSVQGGAALEADHCYNSDDMDAVAEMETIQTVASPAAAPLAGAPPEAVESSYPAGSWASPAAAPRLQLRMQLHLPQSWWPDHQLPDCGYWLGTIVGITGGSLGEYLVQCACDGYEVSKTWHQKSEVINLVADDQPPLSTSTPSTAGPDDVLPQNQAPGAHGPQNRIPRGQKKDRRDGFHIPRGGVSRRQLKLNPQTPQHLESTRKRRKKSHNNTPVQEQQSNLPAQVECLVNHPPFNTHIVPHTQQHTHTVTHTHSHVTGTALQMCPSHPVAGMCG
jgi:hypothetical protein